jgi:RNA polymerase sigma-70 factor (ECF subfamily)
MSAFRPSTACTAVNPKPKQWADMKAEPADIVLLACVLNGDEAGLAALLERHWISVVRYAFSILDDWDAAEDVAEEVFVRLWERRETWGLEGSVRGLLFRIARNMSLDEHRQGSAHRRAVQEVPEPAATATPAEYVDSKELHAAIATALANLPQRRREVFVLVRQHGLSYRDAAHALGVAPQTVANHLSMALEDLREALEPILRDLRGDSAWREGSGPVSVAGEAVGQ